MSGWQPIETAPKDGTGVDLWVSPIGWRCPDARWSKSHRIPGSWGWIHDNDSNDPGAPVVEAREESTLKVTHWMRVEGPLE